MKTLAATLATLIALPLVASADVSKEDIKKLAQAGISDDVIIAFARANGPVRNLSSDDIVELKAAGASDKVLNALLSIKPKTIEETPKREDPVYREPETQVVEKKVYVQSTPSVVYVPSTTYYYDDCYPSYSYYSSWYPRYSYYSSCYPSYGYYYSRPRVGWSVGWCW